MASAQGEQAVLDSNVIELTDSERLVLSALENARRPMDVIALATATALDVEKTLEIVRSLKDKKIVSTSPPEPVRERVQFDENALQGVS